MIESRRNEFIIEVFNSDFQNGDLVAHILKDAGYLISVSEDFTALSEKMKSQPPHFVLFDFDTVEPNLIEWSTKIRNLSHEIRIFVLVSGEKRLRAIHCKQIRLIENFILKPWLSDGEIIDAFDKSALELCYQFENEQLKELLAEKTATASVAKTVTETETAVLTMQKPHLEFATEDVAHSLLQELDFCQNTDHVVDRFLDHASPSPCVFLRFIATRRLLVAQSSKGVSKTLLRGVGVELQSEAELMLLKNPADCLELRQLIEKGLGWDQFGIRTLEVNGVVQGVFLAQNLVDMPSEVVWGIFRQAYNMHLTHDRLKKWMLKDDETGFWVRSYFHESLFAEVSRSRRTGLALSLIVMEIDNMAQTSLKKIAHVVEKTSRVNDILVRLQENQLALILPHTPLQGAAIKAERLRRIMESAGVATTVSLGVSEYPACSTDSEALFQTADDALFTVKQLGRNKVCLASVKKTGGEKTTREESTTL